MYNNLYSKSWQNIRPISQQNNFEKKKINFDAVDISDNFETPKSKYKIMREQANKEVKQKSGIKFYPLGNNRKSKMSSGSREERKSTANQLAYKVNTEK